MKDSPGIVPRELTDADEGPPFSSQYTGSSLSKRHFAESANTYLAFREGPSNTAVSVHTSERKPVESTSGLCGVDYLVEILRATKLLRTDRDLHRLKNIPREEPREKFKAADVCRVG